MKGLTETYQASAIAQEDVAGVAEVKNIVNRIEVELPEKIAPPTDEGIRARIQATLSLESEIVPVDYVLRIHGRVPLYAWLEGQSHRKSSPAKDQSRPATSLMIKTRRRQKKGRAGTISALAPVVFQSLISSKVRGCSYLNPPCSSQKPYRHFM